MTDNKFTDEELEAIQYGLGDYLAPYTNPMIAGPEPDEEKKENLRSMASAYLKASDAKGSLTLMMGDWIEEVSLNQEADDVE